MIQLSFIRSRKFPFSLSPVLPENEWLVFVSSPKSTLLLSLEALDNEPQSHFQFHHWRTRVLQMLVLCSLRSMNGFLKFKWIHPLAPV